VNGGRSVNNNYVFNGANFNHFGQTTGMNYPPPDAVQEIRVQTHNFSSEYGNNSGSQVTVSSKAGTNVFHGSAWEFLRNDVLNARSFFQPRRPTTRQNQLGVAAGGPIIREKLFAFGHYQKLWNRPEVGSTQASVLTDAQRLGDFTSLRTTLRNPVDGLTNRPLTDASGNVCVAGNVIRTGCISPAARTILDRYIPHSPDGTYVSFTDAPPPLEDTGGPQVKDISGSVLPGISKWATSLGGEYSTHATVFSRAGEIFTGVDTSYRSSFSSSPSASRYLIVDNYSLVNARIGFRWADGWSISLWSRNLFNTEYFEFLTPAPGNSGLYVGLPADPRTFGVTMRMSLRSR